MDYGEIKAYIQISPKVYAQEMVVQQRNTCKMVHVQRSSPCGRVEPQANGGRKI